MPIVPTLRGARRAARDALPSSFRLCVWVGLLPRIPLGTRLDPEVLPEPLRLHMTRSLLRTLRRIADGDGPAAHRELHDLAYAVAADERIRPTIRLYVLDVCDAARTRLRRGNRDTAFQVLLPLVAPLLRRSAAAGRRGRRRPPRLPATR